MAIVSAEKFVQAARDNGYAVGGFNTNNLEWTQAILRAAEAKKAPVLIQTSMGAAKYMGGYKVARNLIANLVESMGITVPVAIHLDHGHYEDALECIQAGYTSVMFDGSGTVRPAANQSPDPTSIAGSGRCVWQSWLVRFAGRRCSWKIP